MELTVFIRRSACLKLDRYHRPTQRIFFGDISVVSGSIWAVATVLPPRIL